MTSSRSWPRPSHKAVMPLPAGEPVQDIGEGAERRADTVEAAVPIPASEPPACRHLEEADTEGCGTRLDLCLESPGVRLDALDVCADECQPARGQRRVRSECPCVPFAPFEAIVCW